MRVIPAPQARKNDIPYAETKCTRRGRPHVVARDSPREARRDVGVALYNGMCPYTRRVELRVPLRVIEDAAPTLSFGSAYDILRAATWGRPYRPSSTSHSFGTFPRGKALRRGRSSRPADVYKSTIVFLEKPCLTVPFVVYCEAENRGNPQKWRESQCLQN